MTFEERQKMRQTPLIEDGLGYYKIFVFPRFGGGAHLQANDNGKEAMISFLWDEIPDLIKRLQDIYDLDRTPYTDDASVLGACEKIGFPAKPKDLWGWFNRDDEKNVRSAVWRLVERNVLDYDDQWSIIPGCQYGKF